MVRELLSLTLEDVVQECARRGKPCPDTVIIVGDNTVKELKNGTNLLYAASLVNHGHLRHLGDCMENVWLKVESKSFSDLFWVGEVFSPCSYCQ